MASALMRLEQVVEDGLDRPIELRGLTEVDGHRQRPLGVGSLPHRLVRVRVRAGVTVRVRVRVRVRV